MANTYYDYEVDPFDGDAITHLHFQSSYYGGSDPQIISPDNANFPNAKAGTPTRYFIKTPFIIDVSDLSGAYPMTIRDSTLGLELTRVSGVPTSGEYRIPNATSERRNIIEVHVDQSDTAFDYDLYAVGGVLDADEFNDITITGQIIAEDSINTSEYGETINFRDPTGTETETTTKILKKIIKIEDWNMDTSSSIAIDHGIPDLKKVRSLCATIRDDNDFEYSNLDIGDLSTGHVQGSIKAFGTPGAIYLSRLTGGIFDSTDYDSVSYNRGWVYITYEL